MSKHTEVLQLEHTLRGDGRLSRLLLLFGLLVLSMGNTLDGGVDLGKWFCHDDWVWVGVFWVWCFGVVDLLWLDGRASRVVDDGR